MGGQGQNVIANRYDKLAAGRKIGEKPRIPLAPAAVFVILVTNRRNYWTGLSEFSCEQPFKSTNVNA